MILTPKQEDAIRAVDRWYASVDKPWFYLAGFAGTGKTTLARYFAENIEGVVKFATFTGKAAHVMRKKGCENASTIHKLIYTPIAESKKRLADLEDELDLLKSQPILDYETIKLVEEEIEAERQNAGRLMFTLNTESELRYTDLLIIDECSMVAEKMAEDLLSFNVPILVLGDPEQLPPVHGSGFFTGQEPDIVLEEIHRQALENPIIAMSKTVREGGSLKLGNYGESKVVGRKLDSEEVLAHDIILTGLRKTKKACDDRVRKLRNFTSTLPKQGDLVMCVKNNHAQGLLNGQIWECTEDAVDLTQYFVSLHLKDPETDREIIVTAQKKLFSGIPLERYEHEADIEEFEYAYAITVHKAQGSQWDRILLFDQKDNFSRWNEVDKRRWLYTGITRAAERITIMRL